MTAMADSQKRVSPPAFLRAGPARVGLRLFGGERVRPTQAQAETFRRYMYECDPPADDLVAAMHSLPKGVGRAQFDQALEHGIETVADPLPELVAFFTVLDSVPFWVDFDKMAVAEKTVCRIPMRTQTLLNVAVAFPVSYVSHRVNQVLVRAGDLELSAASRLTETNLWFTECTAPGGMHRFGEGFKTTARVRLIHAYIRAGMNHLEEWDYENWGRPINQSHQTVTLIPIILGALLTVPFGHLQTPKEHRALLHLFRYMAHVMGVRPELQITTFDDLMRLIWLAVWSEFDPDEYSPRLTNAALDAIPTIYGLPQGAIGAPIRWAYRHLHADIASLAFGRKYRRAFGLPPLSPMVAVLPLLAAANLLSDLTRVFTPGATRSRAEHGNRKRHLAIRAMSRRTEANLAFTRDNHTPRNLPVPTPRPPRESSRYRTRHDDGSRAQHP